MALVINDGLRTCLRSRLRVRDRSGKRVIYSTRLQVESWSLRSLMEKSIELVKDF